MRHSKVFAFGVFAFLGVVLSVCNPVSASVVDKQHAAANEEHPTPAKPEYNAYSPVVDNAQQAEPVTTSAEQKKPELSQSPPTVEQKLQAPNPTVQDPRQFSLKDNNSMSPLGITYQSNATATKAIDKNISLFANRIKERFSIWLERSSKYIDIMKDVLKEKEMPEELVFLPIVESGFNPNAYSRARAVGPWQFISATGKRYGLVIDWWRDERKDPVKSTGAAASYLKDLYQMFGSWKLALAAYNAGEGRISKAMKRSGAEDYWGLLHTKQIRAETKEYVPRYIAATMIANTPENYGFQNLEYHKPLAYDEVALESPVDIDVIAKCAGTTVAVIRELNPELRRWCTPINVSQYTVKVPAGSREAFLSNLARIPETERVSMTAYTVKKGETVKGIAKKTGVPSNVILAMNSLGSASQVKAGQVLNIPPHGKYVADLDDRVSAKKGTKKIAKSKKRGAQKVVKSKRAGSQKTVKAKKGDRKSLIVKDKTKNIPDA
ncbi:MAG: LysM peptidoglycan-binding domain-containing protein [Nitrospirae bacterium]|nr:MAG: LysM peptidoglycan-binding domain-containing protein [Nitrospirota bacterium]